MFPFCNIQCQHKKILFFLFFDLILNDLMVTSDINNTCYWKLSFKHCNLNKLYGDLSFLNNSGLRTLSNKDRAAPLQSACLLARRADPYHLPNQIMNLPFSHNPPLFRKNKPQVLKTLKELSRPTEIHFSYSY